MTEYIKNIFNPNKEADTAGNAMDRRAENNERKDAATAEQNCPMCRNHCPKDSLRCERGRAYFGTDNDNSRGGEEERHGHQQEHGRHGRHEESEERHGGHGRSHGGDLHEKRDQEGHRERDDGWRHMDKPEDSLYGLMRQSGHYLFHHRGNEARGQERILQILSQQDGMSQRDLQYQLGVQPGSMSEILGKMEEKGLITRNRSEDDARRIVLTLTPQGADAAASSQSASAGDDLFSALTQEEQETLKTILTKLISTWLRQN